MIQPAEPLTIDVVTLSRIGDLDTLREARTCNARFTTDGPAATCR